MENKFKNVSMNGRFAYVNMCVEKYLFIKYSDKGSNAATVSSVSNQIDSSFPVQQQTAANTSSNHVKLNNKLRQVFIRNLNKIEREN